MHFILVVSSAQESTIRIILRKCSNLHFHLVFHIFSFSHSLSLYQTAPWVSLWDSKGIIQSPLGLTRSSAAPPAHTHTLGFCSEPQLIRLSSKREKVNSTVSELNRNSSTDRDTDALMLSTGPRHHRESGSQVCLDPTSAHMLIGNKGMLFVFEPPVCKRIHTGLLTCMKTKKNKKNN